MKTYQMNQPYVCANSPSRTHKVFGVQLYKNNACALLSHILSIVNPDWLQHACSVCGVYEYGISLFVIFRHQDCYSPEDGQSKFTNCNIQKHCGWNYWQQVSRRGMMLQSNSSWIYNPFAFLRTVQVVLIIHVPVWVLYSLALKPYSI